MASWRAPGSILEAPGLDFRGVGDNFYEIFASFRSAEYSKEVLLAEVSTKSAVEYFAWYSRA